MTEDVPPCATRIDFKASNNLAVCCSGFHLASLMWSVLVSLK